MNKTCDVIVIGGGINGAVFAYELTSAGASVMLVEKDSICAGPTARSCGIVRQHYSHDMTVGVAFEGLQIFQHFDEMVGGECEFHQDGFLLTASEDTVATLAANVKLQQGIGINTRMVTPDRYCRPPTRTSRGRPACTHAAWPGPGMTAIFSMAYPARKKSFSISRRVKNRTWSSSSSPADS